MADTPGLGIAPSSTSANGLALVLYQTPTVITASGSGSNFAADQASAIDPTLAMSSTLPPSFVSQNIFDFNSLPRNVRESIWKLTFPHQRLIELMVKDDEFVHRASEYVIALAIHKESRHFALKFYPLSFSVDFEPSVTPFNFRYDTLLLGRRLKGNHILFRNRCDNKDINCIRHIMVDSNLDWENRKMFNRGHRMGEKSVLMFQGVKNYVSLHTGRTDPLPNWAAPSDFPDIPRHSWNRFPDSDPRDIVNRLITEWSDRAPSWFTKIKKWEQEAFKFGGISNEEKWEPAICVWRIPSIRVLGVHDGMIDAFNDKGYWAKLVMDRAIDDMFD